jgi:glycosyltransferase involved in cell wall biosynthesis
MKSPSVSIVTPVYNGGRYLAECIESVLAQGYSDWEYIIINNCSTDDTLDIARSYAERDRRIRVVCNNTFVPVGENHNTAFRSISPDSQYCKVVSADDVIYPSCIRKMVEFAQSHPFVGIVGSYQLSGTNVKWRGLPSDVSVLPGRDACRLGLLKAIHVFGNPTSTLYRSDLLRMTKAFFPHGEAHADTSACYRSLQHCDFGFLHEILSVERIHPGQVTAEVDKLGAGNVATLETLLDYGPFYLTEQELTRRKAEVLKGYYRYLGGCFLKLKSREFWRFQSSRMRELGLALDWSRVAGAAVKETFVEVKHPVNAFRKFMAILRQSCQRA